MLCLFKIGVVELNDVDYCIFILLLNPMFCSLCLINFEVFGLKGFSDVNLWEFYKLTPYNGWCWRLLWWNPPFILKDENYRGGSFVK